MQIDFNLKASVDGFMSKRESVMKSKGEFSLASSMPKYFYVSKISKDDLGFLQKSKGLYFL